MNSSQQKCYGSANSDQKKNNKMNKTTAEDKLLSRTIDDV
jgi:hypothetical protein